MGIDVATWRARIGLNYCRQSRYACRPLPVQWRATRWGVGEVMNSTPLLLQGCMAVVSLTLILGYTFRGRPIGRCGCGKVCRPKLRGGSVPSHEKITGMADTGNIGVCLLLGVCAVVLALLLMAGDVERNPGPTGKEGSDQVDKAFLNVDDTPLGQDDHFDILTEMMPVASSWKAIGRGLRIEPGRLETIQESNSGKPRECLSEMLTCWLNRNYNVERFGEPTWRAVVKIVAHSAAGDNFALALTIAEQHSELHLPSLPEKTSQRKRSREVEGAEEGVKRRKEDEERQGDKAVGTFAAAAEDTAPLITKQILSGDQEDSCANTTMSGSIMDNCGRSARSATICGGVEFDDLVTGRVGPSYTFRLTRIKSTCKQVESAQTYSQMDPEHTATTTKGDQDCDVLHKATDTLVKWVDDTIRDIEIQSRRKVVKFYVGKTFARQIKNRKFDAMNPNTWRKSGISSRWRHHKQEDYGRNGMVVLTVVTKDDVPQQSIPAFKHHEMYALALEQQLIIHYAFIRGDERLANTSTGMQQQEESRVIGYPIYMAFALDDNGTDLSDEVLESDVEECYIAINQGESLTGEETSVTELQDQRLTKKQEEAIVSASELSASLQETLQQAQNSSSSNERQIHFLNEDTICGIDSVPWDSPEPPIKEASSDDKIFSTDLIQPSTQPHNEHVLVSTQNEKNPVEVGTASHLLSERKRPSSEMLESSPCQKEQRLENSSSSSSSTTKYQLKKSQHLGRVVPELGDSKEMPIVVEEPSVGKQMTQLQNQDKQPTLSEASNSTGRH